MSERRREKPTRRLGCGQTANLTASRRRHVAMSALALTLATAFIVGCATDGRLANNDPLLGGPAIRPGASSAVAGQPTSNRPLPPLPAPSSATSTAALAAGPPKPLDPTHDLRIGKTPPLTPTSGSWQGNGNGNGSGIVLQTPQPLAEPIKNDGFTGMSSAVAAGNSRITSHEQAEAVLAARGVKWQRLEHANGEWKFACSLPGRQNTNINRTYEATGPDSLTAIQRVLDKVQSEQ